VWSLDSNLLLPHITVHQLQNARQRHYSLCPKLLQLQEDESAVSAGVSDDIVFPEKLSSKSYLPAAVLYAELLTFEIAPFAPGTPEMFLIHFHHITPEISGAVYCARCIDWLDQILNLSIVKG
jgi:hypothetical protein